MMPKTVNVEAVFGRIESFLDDLITDQIVSFGAHTRPELALLLSVIEPGDAVFDIGAHIGTFAIPIAQKVGSFGKVLAVEAQPTIFDVLNRNVKNLNLNAIVRSLCVLIGASSMRYDAQVIEHNAGRTFFVPSAQGRSVRAVSLDELAAQNFLPRVMKIDIEGLELVALQGAQRILESRPILYVEVNREALARYRASIEEMSGFLSKLGYKFFHNAGDRNGRHDNYVLRSLNTLEEAGNFFDVLAIHGEDPRIKRATKEVGNLSAIEYKALFEKDICDLPTHEYLRNRNLVRHLDRVIAPRESDDMHRIKARLELGTPPRAYNPNLRVALCNIALEGYAGSELWTLDVAKYFKSISVEVIVFSSNCGQVAEDIRRAGIPVTSSIKDVEAFAPNILHVNHFESSQELVARVKHRASVINMVHGLLPRSGLPGYGGVNLYACVSIHAKAKIHALTGADWSEIYTLPNFFDERRFTQISNPKETRRATLLSNRTPPQFREQLCNWLAPLGFELDHIGHGGKPTREPERLLPHYDLIFAVGRSAIEGLASGAHVILWDFGIIGPAVTMNNFWQCVTTNFDLASNTLPWAFIEDGSAANWLREQVLKISESGRRETTQAVRTYLSLSAAGCRLLEMYDRALESAPPIV
jgi:FkbM family methyltransferase